MIHVVFDSDFTDLVYSNIKNIYQITPYGQIRNKNTGKFLKPCKSEKGYMMCCLALNDGKSKTFKIHRIIASMFLPNDNVDKTEVNHISGDKTDNSIFNLEWCTHQENITHAYNLGLIPPMKGERNGSCKYPIEMIKSIIVYIKDNKTNSDIRNMLVLNYPDIKYTRYLLHDLRRQKIWKHLF